MSPCAPDLPTVAMSLGNVLKSSETLPHLIKQGEATQLVSKADRSSLWIGR